MSPMGSAHLNTVEAENRSLREAMVQIEARIRGWEIDIACGLTPTPGSFKDAEIICRKARRKEAVS